MKKSKELLGLTVISIEDGKDLGHVSDFVINPAKGAVEYLIINSGTKYLGLKVLPFGLVEGVGEYAVTVQSADAMADLADEAEIKGLLEKDVHVIGTRILTKKGKLIGTVSEFLVDDESEGKISGCELNPGDGVEVAGTIPADQIITFGKDILVVHEGVENSLVNPVVSDDSVAPEEGTDSPVEQETPVDEEASSTSEQEASASTKDNLPAGQQKAPEDEPKESPKEEEETKPSQAAVMFEQRQRQYLLGRKATKRIETDKGELIVEEGQVLTEDILDKAKQAGKFAELSMNTKP